MTLQKGDLAPDFSLKDQNNKDVKLSDFRGRKVVISFHPLAFTPICSLQMKNLEEKQADLKMLNAVGIGVSIDSSFAKSAWAKELAIEKTPLLADFWPHGGVAEQFAVLRPEGFSERAVFIVDEQGKIIFSKIYPLKEVPDMQEILAALK